MICYLSPQDIESLEPHSPRLWRALGQLSVLNLDNALMYASALLKGDATMKITSTLVRLAGPDMASDAVISLPCSQQELGEMAGLSRNSVGPAIRELERAGLLSRDVYGEIAFNPPRLAQASGKRAVAQPAIRAS